MRISTVPTTLALAVALACLGACGGDTPSGGGEAAHEDHGHDHDHEHGPKGGAVVLLGDHAWHLEVLHHLDEQAVDLYAYDADMEPAALEGTPRLKLATSAGQVSLAGEATDDGGWRFVHETLAGEPDRARFQVTLGGKTWSPDMPEHHHHDGDDHDHDHGHEHGDEHGPHDGMVAALEGGDGFVELKLHDDLGDLELWITKDETGDAPLDLPLDATITVRFEGKGQEVRLAVRDREKNADEDGTPNLRDGKTNYFIFPGDSGADASWLVGADFEDEVRVAIEADGKTHRTATFALRPHTHHDDHDHEHD